MEVQIKTFSGLAHGNHVIVMTRGIVAIGGCSYILDKVAEATRPLLDCMVLIDFQDSTFQFLPSDIGGFVDSERYYRLHRRSRRKSKLTRFLAIFGKPDQVNESFNEEIFC